MSKLFEAQNYNNILHYGKICCWDKLKEVKIHI